MKKEKRVAVVTEEMAGLNKGGGIGTCANTLVRSLLAERFSVDIIITDPGFDKQNVKFIGCSVVAVANFAKERGYEPTDHVTHAFCVHEILCLKNYDAVHFNDWRGSGYFYAMAKTQGFVDSRIITHTHGPSKWVRRYNLELADLNMLEVDALEKGQIENSDIILSPSEYLLEWYRAEGFQLPEAHVVNWQLPEWMKEPGSRNADFLRTRAIQPRSIDEVIFFGRHERRKGFETFIEAIASRDSLRGISITFVGRFDRIDREFTGSMAFRLLHDHYGSIRFINDLGHKDAVAYLESRARAIVVMPSAIENSPCTVGECFTIGIPFIATAVGGTPELFRDGIMAPNLVDNSPEALADKIESIYNSGLPEIESTLNPTSIKTNWSDLHKTLNCRHAERRISSTPLVSVCLVHHNRPDLLKRALTALDKQTYKQFEVILIDDGSTPHVLKQLSEIENESRCFSLKIIRSSNNYLGAARNLAAKHANGEWLIFHDDDNIAEPQEIECFIKAALIGGYDQLTSQYLVFDDTAGPEKAKIKYFPIGLGGPFSYFRNRFGDANAIIRKSAFEKIGGFSELKKVGWEDWELFLKLHAAGAKQGIVPFPLFRYRASAQGMLSTTSYTKNWMRIIRAASKIQGAVPPEVLEIATRDGVGKNVLDKTWDLLAREREGTLHQEMMPLDPNSDAAREKLMELGFALGRHGDAVELGLGLKNGFHRVTMLLQLLQPRVGASSISNQWDAMPEASSPRAFLLRGWVDYERQPFVAQRYVDQDGAFDVLGQRLDNREDVNEFLSRSDTLPRGFTIVAARDEDESQVSQNPGDTSTFEEEGIQRVQLSSDDLRYGYALLKGIHQSANVPSAGFLDFKRAGRIAGIDLRPPDGVRLANRIRLSAPPKTLIFVMKRGAEHILEEILLDRYGTASFQLTIEDGPDESMPASKLKLFITCPYGDLKVTLSYAAMY